MQDMRSTVASGRRDAGASRSTAQPGAQPVKGANSKGSPRRGQRRWSTDTSRPHLTVEQKREKDARQQHWLNLLMIEQVRRATEGAGWYVLTLQDVLDFYQVEDYGTSIVFVHPEGGRYKVAHFDEFEPDTVLVRKVG